MGLNNTVLEIHGTCHKKFLKLKSTFEENFKVHNEIGAALCVFHKGIKVVDIWAGLRNEKLNESWQADTIVPLFSVTKGLTALCFLMLAERKLLDYQKPVAYYWSEFSKNGKSGITVKQLLEHRAGLHSLDSALHITDFIDKPEKVYRALIDEKPSWAPDDKQAYGAQVWGAYAAELFKQIKGESAGVFFHREVVKKMGLNIYLGLPETLQPKVATVYPVSNLDRILLLIPHILRGDDTEGRVGRAVLKGNSEVSKAYLNPSTGLRGMEIFNDAKLHRQELLWANGIGDARSLAKIYNVFINGGKNGKVKFTNSSLLKQLSATNALRYDEVIHKNMGWNLGFLKEEKNIFSPNSETFGHAGMGGCLSFADPKAKIAFGYVCNKMDYLTRPRKTTALCESLYECIK